MRMAASVVGRIFHGAGMLCVVAAFALLSPGVKVVRAGGTEPATRAEPTRAAPPPPPGAAPAAPAPRPASSPAAGAAPASPFVQAADVENARRPGVSGIETAPGVVVLNTRGYNYGPPPTPIEPEALQQESRPR